MRLLRSETCRQILRRVSEINITNVFWTQFSDITTTEVVQDISSGNRDDQSSGRYVIDGLSPPTIARGGRLTKLLPGRGIIDISKFSNHNTCRK